MAAYGTKSAAGSKGPTKPGQSGKFVLPKSDSPKGNAPKYLGQTQKFEDGWPKYKDHDPRLIAKVWKEGANAPYQLRTTDGTYSVPKGMGLQKRGSLTKDKSSARTPVERERPNVAGFGKGSHKERSGGN